ncbi:Chemokine XC receptor 1 G-protein coupled receptor 5 [Collichthys lucidus]|uniref:Chemokine XC receptor 1 G-protein coupled receptor 5 n=1 Tax=Collichthys lucidus TaxID=240159 RepID=A0A4U5UWY9_COLLU|nr:Chemokine XC receptor 1 G-protein coupled receptor 5 [Collichthys lucidus]
MSPVLYITTLPPGCKPADVTDVVRDNSTMENEDVNSQVEGPCHLPDLETIKGAFYILTFILSVTGNILLLCVLVFYENLKNVTNLFVMNLICSDLIFTVTLPFWAVHSLHHWIFGDLACKFMTAAYIIGMYSSVILLTAITVDRFITVVLNWPSRPVRRQRCAIGACVAAWIISIAASIRDATIAKTELLGEIYICEVEDSHSLTTLGYYLQVSLLFFLPFAIIVFCYSAIIKTVLQASNRKKYRTIVVVLCIVTVFFICWGPYNVFLFVMVLYEPTCHEFQPFYTAFTVCQIVAYSHCCMNPLLYMLSQKTRRHLLQLLRCENPRKESRERGTGQSTSYNHNVALTAQNTAIMLDLPTK